MNFGVLGEIGKTTYDYLVSIGLKAERAPTNLENWLTWTGLDVHDILKLIKEVEHNKVFIYNVKMEIYSLTFYYYPESRAVKYTRSSSKCSGLAKLDCRNVNLEDFLYLIKAFDYIQKIGRHCCLIIDGRKTVKAGLKGYRMHCLGIEDCVKRILSGGKLKFGRHYNSGEKKCVENSTLSGIFRVKFGSMSDLLSDFLKLRFPDDYEKLMGVFLKIESARRQSKCIMGNWQWKRLCVDFSYLRELCGSSPLSGIDRSIPPTVIAKNFSKNRASEIKEIELKEDGLLLVKRVPYFLGTLNTPPSFKGSIKKSFLSGQFKSVNTVKKGDSKAAWAKFEETRDETVVKRFEEKDMSLWVEKMKERSYKEVLISGSGKERSKNSFKLGDNYNYLKTMSRVNELMVSIENNSNKERGKPFLASKGQGGKKVKSHRAHNKEISDLRSKFGYLKCGVMKTIYSVITDKEHYDFTQNDSFDLYQKTMSGCKHVRERKKKSKKTAKNGRIFRIHKCLGNLYFKCLSKKMKEEKYLKGTQEAPENKGQKETFTVTERSDNKPEETPIPDTAIESFKEGIRNVNIVSNYLGRLELLRVESLFKEAKGNIDCVRSYCEIKDKNVVTDQRREGREKKSIKAKGVLTKAEVIRIRREKKERAVYNREIKNRRPKVKVENFDDIIYEHPLKNFIDKFH